eukprot:TRINITY_DN102471_c0_g1_i1.p1 TRINITY_DN102471_c0_g1~~TRINITY_DN102471_c0_g1_i1.p1  ORF type:complete len:419 (+),score=71.18 TRINITY_DN102471_c0_g1_i1:130-1386(+)
MVSVFGHDEEDRYFPAPSWLGSKGRELHTAPVDAAEHIYMEPHGIPHKRIGTASIPPMLQAESITQLSYSWQPAAKDVLLAMSPGLMSNFRILEPLFTLVGDPLRSALAEMGEIGMACNFRDRLFESQQSDPSNTCAVERCFFTALPPWLLPEKSFEKIVVFLADPRCLILRETLVWNFIQQCIGGGNEEIDASLFVRNYLKKSSSHLGGEELRRLAAWAEKEHEEPQRVRLVFVEDFLSDTAAAIQDLARFLGASPSNTQEAIDKALVVRETGLFHVRAGVPECEHFSTSARAFEDLFARLPGEFQGTWHSRLAAWDDLPNQRMKALALSLQRHSYDHFEKPSRLIFLHEEGLCKPCSYFYKNNCRQAEDCLFCHESTHRDRLIRPSKKERLRRRKRMIEKVELTGIRTPSPSGLSS